MRFIVMIFCLTLLTACTVTQSNSNNLQLQSIIQKRSLLQFHYAKLADEFWQRTGKLFQEKSNFPMRSKDIPTLQKINQQLQSNIDTINKELAILNTKIEKIKNKEIKGNVLQLSLNKGIWQQSQNVASKPITQYFSQRLKQSQLLIVAGDRLTWQLFQQDNTPLPAIDVILSEQGYLYIDGQKATHLNLHTASSTTLTSIPVFDQQPFAIGHINLSLTTQPVD